MTDTVKIEVEDLPDCLEAIMVDGTIRIDFKPEYDPENLAPEVEVELSDWLKRHLVKD